jgi:hypothetical protein
LVWQAHPLQEVPWLPARQALGAPQEPRAAGESLPSQPPRQKAQPQASQAPPARSPRVSTPLPARKAAAFQEALFPCPLEVRTAASVHILANLPPKN